MGHLVTRLHSQLLAALCSESQARVRAGTLRALGTLAVGSPYSRLPPELASGTRVRSRRLGFPAWHPGDRVRVWVDGPINALAAEADGAPERQPA